MQENLLNFIPQHNVQFENHDDNVVILFPKFRNKIILKLFPKLKDMFFKIKLDNIASYVWRLIDGNKKVDDIISDTKNKFSNEPQIEDRTIKFIQQLYYNKFITFKES